ncbi:MAG TPA: SIMPL domain-containing protein [Burkholderiaceae bacterium]
MSARLGIAAVAAAVAALAGVSANAAAPAQPAPAVAPAAGPARFEGTLLVVGGSAEIEVDNDEAVATFYLEVQDPDLAQAQSQLNRRVADGVAALKQADPGARLETEGYAAYPVYAGTGARKIVGWRVRQNARLRTADLAALPRTVAAGQQQLALGGLEFRVSKAAGDKVQAELIARALANLNARVSAAVQALGQPGTTVRIEEIDFGGVPARPQPVMAFASRARTTEAVAEPEFEPGRSTQSLSVSARVRLVAP